MTPLFRAGAVLAVLPLALPGALHAQANIQTPAPQTRPATPIYTLPGGAERFNLPPAGGQPTATPTPAPTPAVVIPPVAVTRGATPAPRPERVPRRAPREAAPVPVVAPVPAATETPVPAAPVAQVPAPVVATPAPVAPADAFPWWGWALVALGLAGTGAAGFAWGRRKRPRAAEADAAIEPPLPAPPPAPRFVARPVSPPSAPAPAPPPPLQVALRPIRGAIANGEVVLDVEVGINNRGEAPAEQVRLVLGMISASPDQDARIAGFHASAPSGQMTAPIALPPGANHRVTVQLRLPEAGIHVVTVAGRAMFVPIVLVNLRWRAGLSVRTTSDAFMVGTGDGAGGKLGPFWIDRGARILDRISARRYVPDRAAA